MSVMIDNKRHILTVKSIGFTDHQTKRYVEMFQIAFVIPEFLISDSFAANV